MKCSGLALSLTLALGAAAAGFASQAAAENTCDGFGATTFAPAHPIATDLIGVHVQSWQNPPAVVPTTTTLSQVSVAPGPALFVDVIVTPHPGKYPGYRTIGAPYDEAFGAVGPLPVGEHRVHTSIIHEDAEGSFTQPCGGPFLSTLKIGTERVHTVRAPVVEYYNTRLDHYFMTQDANEIALLDAGAFRDWARTGEAFLAYLPGQSDNLGRPVCRFFGEPVPLVGSHFYSATRAECLELALPPASEQWMAETSDAFETGLPDRSTGVCTLGEAPLYRLWNGRADSNHRYTTSESTREQMVAKGWTSEGFGPLGVAMCVPVR